MLKDSEVKYVLPNHQLFDTVKLSKQSTAAKAKNLSTNAISLVRIYELSAIKKGAIDKLKNLKDFRNLCRIVHYHTDSEYLYVCFEHYDAQDLKSYLLKAGGFLELEEVRSIISEVAAGLDYLHSLGITHGKVKLQNIIMLQKGHHTISNNNEDQAVKLKVLGYERMMLSNVDEVADKMKLSEFTKIPYILDKLDVWAIGKLLFLLIGGETGKDSSIILGSLVIKAKVKLSTDALSFLSMSLQGNYESRMNWSELMSHPFIKLHSNSQTDSNSKPLKEDNSYAYFLPNLSTSSQMPGFPAILVLENSRLKSELAVRAEEVKRLRKKLEDDENKRDPTKMYRKAYADLKKWILESGGHVGAIELASLTDGVRKVVTRKNIKSGQRILFVPNNILFTLEKIANSCATIQRIAGASLKHPTNSQLSIWCLEERAKPDSPYKIFFDTFLDVPRNYPLFYDEYEMWLLVGSAMGSNPAKHRSDAEGVEAGHKGRLRQDLQTCACVFPLLPVRVRQDPYNSQQLLLLLRSQRAKSLRTRSLRW
eukprot:TRINITY_DN12065_c0_g2_i1.p1 TRINITY_DN12065_c0_g2~~TRINITY_DN12065_c0_g2_i1.p1  ORF type:complete len:537 (-),score=39.60 TRINITY_DN12065_c0_g2_i1:931-2541(-)